MDPSPGCQFSHWLGPVCAHDHPGSQGFLFISSRHSIILDPLPPSSSHSTCPVTPKPQQHSSWSLPGLGLYAEPRSRLNHKPVPCAKYPLPSWPQHSLSPAGCPQPPHPSQQKALLSMSLELTLLFTHPVHGPAFFLPPFQQNLNLWITLPRPTFSEPASLCQPLSPFSSETELFAERQSAKSQISQWPNANVWKTSEPSSQLHSLPNPPQLTSTYKTCKMCAAYYCMWCFQHFALRLFSPLEVWLATAVFSWSYGSVIHISEAPGFAKGTYKGCGKSWAFCNCNLWLAERWSCSSSVIWHHLHLLYFFQVAWQLAKGKFLLPVNFHISMTTSQRLTPTVGAGVQFRHKSLRWELKVNAPEGKPLHWYKKKKKLCIQEVACSQNMETHMKLTFTRNGLRNPKQNVWWRYTWQLVNQTKQLNTGEREDQIYGESFRIVETTAHKLL